MGKFMYLSSPIMNEVQSLVFRIPGFVVSIGFNCKLRLPCADEEQRIGAAGAALITDGDLVILDSGTTTQQIAKHVKNRKD